jgi:exopolysaccharide biosynthesis polyprenyl glycosylphosphotransferase
MSLAIDAAMLIAAVALAELTSPGRIPAIPPPWIVAFALLVLAFLYARGMYRSPRHLRMLDGTRTVITAAGLATAIVISLRVVLADSSFVAAQSVRVWLFATVFLTAGRVSLSLSERRARRAGEAGRPTLIVGAGKVGRLVATRLREHPEIGLRPVGFLDKDPLDDCSELALPVLGASWDLDRIVKEYGVQQVIMTFSTAPHEVLLRLVERCDELGVEVSLVPRLFEKMTQRVEVDHVGALPFISTRRANPKGWQFGVKYAADRLIAAVLVALMLPLLAGTALVVYLSLGRPLLFRQSRIGLDGREFTMLKFRTLRGGPEGRGEADADWALEQLNGSAAKKVSVPDRSTPAGKVLRRLSLDELPQLLNVVSGQMSLVGPRPERTHYVHVFEDKVYRYADRHRVKSGITGWAQVNGLRGKTSLADRIEWDNYYIENWSLWFDFKILLLTLAAVLRAERSINRAPSTDLTPFSKNVHVLGGATENGSADTVELAQGGLTELRVSRVQDARQPCKTDAKRDHDRLEANGLA